MKKIAVISLGCPKNLVDTEYMMGFLKFAGDVVFVSDVKDADIILVNTCGFINQAKEESIDEILTVIEEKKENPEKKVIVAGCLYQRYKDELRKELPEVDDFVGVDELESVVEKVLAKKIQPNKPYLYREILTLPHFSYLKISEGCSNSCAYCAIPMIRGPLKSRPKEEILEEAHRLAEKGVRELYIIAQDTTAYGFDKKEDEAFIDLMDSLESVKGIDWIRLMYTYPTHVTDGLIEFMGTSRKLVKYIDVPFQHVSDKVLLSMGRKYSKKSVEKLIDKLRIKIPGITIRTTFIVGYPTETERDFEELVSFLKDKELDWVGFFKYSREEGTVAYSLGDISEEVKNSRQDFVEDIQYGIFEKKHKELIGKDFKLLVDAPSHDLPGYVEARSYRNAYEIDGIIYLKGNYEPGTFVDAKIVKLASNVDLMAEPIKLKR